MVKMRKHFKKRSILSVYLAAALFINIFIFSFSVKAESSLMLQDFQNITDSTAINSDPNGGSIDGKINTKMKVQVGEPVKDANGNITQHFGCINIAPSTHDWSGKDGIELYVENPNTTEIGFEVAFETATGGVRRWLLPDEAHDITAVKEDGEVITSRVQYCSLFAPAGFKGILKIPFSLFANGGETAQNTDLTNVSMVFANFNCTVWNGISAYLGDINLYPSGNSTSRVVTDFNGMTAENMNSKVIAYFAYGSGSTAVIAPTNTSETGTAVHIAGGTAASVLEPTVDIGNATGADGIKFWCKNEDNTNAQVFFFQFDDFEGERFISDSGTAVFKDKNGNETTAQSSLIPAGFEGTVTIPFSSFHTRGWSGNGTIDLSLMRHIFIEITANSTNYIIDDIALTYNGGSTVLDIDSLGDSANIQNWVWADGGKLNVSLVKDLRVKVGGANTTTQASWINLYFPQVAGNWTNMNGVEYKVTNLAATPVKFVFGFEDGNERWIAQSAKKARYISDDGGVVIDDSTQIPAGFKGIVQIPFSSFGVHPYCFPESGRNGKMDLGTIGNMLFFDFDAADNGDSLIFDDFKAINASIDVSIPDNEGQKPGEQSRVIENFDEWTDTGKISSSFGDALDIILANDIADSGNSLKVNIKGTDTNPIGIGNRNFNLMKTNWSGAKGIEVWVHNPNPSAVPVRLMFQEDSGELWLPKTDSKVCLVSKDGSRQIGSVIYRIVEIPANFDGVLQMPFNSFVALEGELKRDGLLQLNAITKMYFEFDTVNFKGKNLYLDTLKILYNDIDLTVPEPPKPDPEVTSKVLENFDNWTTATINERFVSRFGGTIGTEISDSVKDSGKGLKLTVGQKTATVDIGNVQLSGVGGNWNGAKGIRLWVKNPQNDPIALRLMFDESSGELWLTKTGGKVVLISNDGTRTLTKINYNIIDIPADFCGFIELPLDSFGAEVPDLIKDKVLQLDNIKGFYFEFDCKNYHGNSLYVDTLTLLYRDVDMTGSQTETNKIVNGIKTLEDFDKWTNTTIGMRMSPWVDGGKVTPSVVTSNTASGKGIRFEIGKKGKNDVGVIDLKGLDSDWSGAKGIQMYVCNTEKVTVPFRFHFEEATGTNERWITSSGKNVVLCRTDGKKIITTIQYDSINIPAGFKGYVQIPFDSFDVISWHKTGNKKLELGSIGLVFFEFDCALFPGKSLTFDNIGLVYNDINAKVQSMFRGDVKILQNFDSIKDSVELQSLIPYYVNGGMVVNTITSNGANGSNAMKVSVGKTNAKTGDKYSVLNIPINESNWTGYEGISFWVSNPSSDDLLVEIAFEEKNLERWQTAIDTRVAIKSTDGTESIKDCMPVLRIPAGFKGEMRIPFKNFKATSWSLSDNKLDLSAITTMFLIADCSVNEGKSYIIDDIGIYKSEFSITTSFNKPSKMWK